MKRFFINLIASAGILLAGLLCLQLDTLLPFALHAAPEPIYWFLLLCGLCPIVLAEISFWTRGGATGAPADPTKHLVISGIYRWVRNPIYLGGALVLFGVSLARNSPTLLLAAILFIPVMHFTVVRSEERRLERDFRVEYSAYKLRVPRWIPRPPKG